MPNQVASVLLDTPSLTRTAAKAQPKTAKTGKDFLEVLNKTATVSKTVASDTSKPVKPVVARRNAKTAKSTRSSRKAKPSDVEDSSQPAGNPDDAEQTAQPESAADQPVQASLSEEQAVADPSNDQTTAENDTLATNVTPVVPLSNLRMSDLQNSEEPLPAQSKTAQVAAIDQSMAIGKQPPGGTTPATPADPATPAQSETPAVPAAPATPAVPSDQAAAPSQEENADPMPASHTPEKPDLLAHPKVMASKNTPQAQPKVAPQESSEAAPAKTSTPPLATPVATASAQPDASATKPADKVDHSPENSQASSYPKEVPSPMASAVAVSATNTAHAMHTVTNVADTAPSPLPVSFADDNLPRIVTSIHTELLPHGGRMQIRLDPPELGALQVTVQMRDGQMTASFQTSNDEATRLLSHSLTQLKDSLQAQGVSVEKLHVQQMPRQQQANADQQQQNTPFDGESARQEQQRRQMLQKMWDRLANGRDPLDMMA